MGFAVFEIVLERISQWLAKIYMDDNLLVARFNAYNNLEDRMITVDGIDYWTIFQHKIEADDSK